MSRLLSGIFTECSKDQNIIDVGTAQVKGINLPGGSDRMEILLDCEQYIPRELLLNCELVIRETYKLSLVRIKPTFRKSHFGAAVFDDVVSELRRTVSTVNGFFTGCRWEYDEQAQKVTANMAIDCAQLLEKKDFCTHFKRLVADEFGLNVDIELKYDEQLAQELADMIPEKREEDYTPAPQLAKLDPIDQPKPEEKRRRTSRRRSGRSAIIRRMSFSPDCRPVLSTRCIFIKRLRQKAYPSFVYPSFRAIIQGLRYGERFLHTRIRCPNRAKR